MLYPFVELKTEYYDLGLEYRNETNDAVTVDAANAVKKYGVGVNITHLLQMLPYGRISFKRNV